MPDVHKSTPDIKLHNGILDDSSHSFDSSDKKLITELLKIYNTVHDQLSFKLEVCITTNEGIGASIEPSGEGSFIIKFNLAIAKETQNLILKASASSSKFRLELRNKSEALKHSLRFQELCKALPKYKEEHIYDTLISEDISLKVVLFLFFHELCHIHLKHIPRAKFTSVDRAAKQHRFQEFEADVNSINELVNFIDCFTSYKYGESDSQLLQRRIIEGDLFRAGCALVMVFDYFWLVNDGTKSKWYPSGHERVSSAIGGVAAIQRRSELSIDQKAIISESLMKGIVIYQFYATTRDRDPWPEPDSALKFIDELRSDQTSFETASKIPKVSLMDYLWNLAPANYSSTALRGEALSKRENDLTRYGDFIGSSIYFIRIVKALLICRLFK